MTVVRLGGTDQSGQFVAVHLWHVEVGDEQGIIRTTPALEGLTPVGHDVGLEAEQGQLSAQDFLIDRVVFSDQDGLPARVTLEIVRRERIALDAERRVRYLGGHEPAARQRHAA
jgi:hypothetical protein